MLGREQDSTLTSEEIHEPQNGETCVCDEVRVAQAANDAKCVLRQRKSDDRIDSGLLNVSKTKPNDLIQSGQRSRGPNKIDSSVFAPIIELVSGLQSDGPYSTLVFPLDCL